MTPTPAALVALMQETLDVLNEASDAHLRRGDIAANNRAIALATRLRAAALALSSEGQAREWECWVNVYPDGVVMPYTGEVKARQMRSAFSSVEVVHARVIEIPAAREVPDVG